MPDSANILGLYLHLAQASLRRNRPHVRDRLLILSGIIAEQMKLNEVAAYCRHLVLEHNPNHLIRRWDSIGAALQDSDFLYFVKQLWRRYPLEKAESMLNSLGIEMACERDAYYSDGEYAAALLGVTPKLLASRFGKENDD